MASERAWGVWPRLAIDASASSGRGSLAVTLRCLLVDDSREFLTSATRLLESQGVEVVGRATNGREALRLALALAPDVALVDIDLGEEDGLAVAHEIEDQVASVRVVLISAND